MIKHFKITFKNKRELKCTFSDAGNILKIRLGFEIQKKSKIDLENEYRSNRIDYLLIAETVTMLKDSINHLLITKGDKHEYNDSVDLDNINYYVNELANDLFVKDVSIGCQLEMGFELEKLVPIGILKSRNSILFKDRYVELYKGTSSCDKSDNETLCNKFLIKVKL